jgi:N-acetylglucosaminyldiphosphoundecaprenol N-acetyl-beta-D-mannosaminyltransferase
LGVSVHALTMDQVVSIANDAIADRRRLLVGVVNAAKVVNMQRQPLLQQSVTDCDLVLADGMAVVWAARLLGRPLPERIAGIDLMEQLLAAAQTHGHRVYLLGATEEVLRATRERIAADFPGLAIAGSRNGYFAEDQEAGICSDIRNAQADVLFVGISSPKKEAFLARWKDDLGVPVCHGVGGSFDVIAGKVKRAPRLMQRLCLEWLYRVIQEPRRMWRRYLVTNVLFGKMVLSQLPRSRRAKEASPR